MKHTVLLIWLFIGVLVGNATAQSQYALFPQWGSEYLFPNVQVLTVANPDQDTEKNIIAVSQDTGIIILNVLERISGRLSVVYKRGIVADAVNDVVVADTDRDGKEEIIIAGRAPVGGVNKGVLWVFEHDGISGNDNFILVATLLIDNFEPVAIEVMDSNGNTRKEIVVGENQLVGLGGRIEFYEDSGSGGLNVYTALSDRPRVSQMIFDAAKGDTNGDNGGNPNEFIFTAGSPAASGFLTLTVNKIDGSAIGPSTMQRLLMSTGISANAIEVADINNDNREEIVVFSKVSSTVTTAVVFRYSGTNYVSEVLPQPSMSGVDVLNIDIDKGTRAPTAGTPLIFVGASGNGQGGVYLFNYAALRSGSPPYSFSGSYAGTAVKDAVIIESKGLRADFDRDNLHDAFVAVENTRDHLVYLEQRSLSVVANPTPRPGETVTLQIDKLEYANRAYVCAFSERAEPGGYPPPREIIEGRMELGVTPLLIYSLICPICENGLGILDARGLSQPIRIRLPMFRLTGPLTIYNQCYLSSSRGVDAFTNVASFRIIP